MKGQIKMTIKIYGNHLVAINTEDVNTPRVITTSNEQNAHKFSKEEALGALKTLHALGHDATIV